MRSARPTLLLAAMHAELAPVVRRLGLRWQGEVARGEVLGRAVIAAAGGVGRQRMLSRLRSLLNQHDVSRVVLIGFAGGLDPALEPGTVLRFGEVRNGNGAAVSLDRGERAVLLTIDRLAATPAEKRSLFEAHGAAAVDMETFAVAEAMRQRGRRLTVLRAISDPAHVCLPRHAVHWVTPTGGSRVAGPAAWLFANPLQCGTMLTLWRHTRRAGQRLAGEVEQLLRAPGEE